MAINNVNTFFMKSPNWLKNYVQTLDIPQNGRYRSDCPVCNRKNTFSVNENNFQRMWNCFHVDCHVSGIADISFDKNVKADNVFKNKMIDNISVDINFDIPHTFVSLSRNLVAEHYVKRVGAYNAYLKGLVDIRFDIKKNRVVYLLTDNNKVIDACGRALGDIKPKWYRYGHSKHPFICGDSRGHGFIVEDCASACAVSDIVSGIALMGTSLLDEHIDVIKNFKKVYVALDKDATKKSIDIVRRLVSYVDTKLVVLKQDLKDMRREDRNEFIRSKVG